MMNGDIRSLEEMAAILGLAASSRERRYNGDPEHIRGQNDAKRRRNKRQRDARKQNRKRGK